MNFEKYKFQYILYLKFHTIKNPAKPGCIINLFQLAGEGITCAQINGFISCS
jgi:hypothetical protein